MAVAINSHLDTGMSQLLFDLNRARPSVSTDLFCLLISPLQDLKRGFRATESGEEQPGTDNLKLEVDKAIPFS